MGHGHEHGLSEVRHERPLWWALGLTGTFLVVEVVGGLLTNSLALLSDAAHMATDTAGLVIALVAVLAWMVISPIFVRNTKPLMPMMSPMSSIFFTRKS